MAVDVSKIIDTIYTQKIDEDGTMIGFHFETKARNVLYENTNVDAKLKELSNALGTGGALDERFVTLDTRQEITGRKVFTGGLVVTEIGGSEEVTPSNTYSEIYPGGISYFGNQENPVAHYDLEFPKKSGTIALTTDITWANIPDKPVIPDVSEFITADDIPDVEVSVTGSGNAITSASVDITNKHKVILTKGTTFATTATATQSANGLMSSTDKKNLDDMWTLFGTTAGDPDELVNTVREVLKVFENFPEGTDIAKLLEEKADVSALENYVTLNTPQTIQASKRFSSGLTIDDSFELYAQGISTTFSPSGITKFIPSESTTYSYTYPDVSGVFVVDSQLKDYVTLGTQQTITGKKTFTGGVYFGSDTDSIYIKDNSIMLGGEGAPSLMADRLYLVGSGNDVALDATGYLSFNSYQYNFPSKSGTLLVDKDLPSSLPPTGVAGGDLTGTYPNPTIGSGKVTESKLATDAVTTNKIKNGNVTNAKLDTTGVTEGTYSVLQVNAQGRVLNGANLFTLGTSDTVPSSVPVGGFYLQDITPAA